ncbi:MAG: OmpH family outer membrane protein [Bacteroidetes bacterium]|nr:OmpH family outer membrane protein [Bacteroidota bacterium]MBS1945318.1 OmpH family outer membrane protein [Bacteroidota bacterium]
MNSTLLRTALLALLLAPMAASAQRIAFVDTKYILEKMPDYTAAQQELDRTSKKWQDEIDGRWAQIKRLQEAYNAEAVLLTDEMKKSRQQEIDQKQQEARDLQQKRFGVGGDLFKKRQELIQPIQDRIFDAVKEVAGTTYIAIFDIGGVGNNVLYASEKYDKSDNVLRKLGIRPGKEGEGSQRGNDQDEGDHPPDLQKDKKTPPGQAPPADRGNNINVKPKQ